jgi:hypothetical protein
VKLRAGRPEFDSWQEKEMFLLCTASRPALRPTQPRTQRVPEVLFPGGKAVGREADHSPPSIAEVANGGAIPPLSHISS